MSTPTRCADLRTSVKGTDLFSCLGPLVSIHLREINLSPFTPSERRGPRAIDDLVDFMTARILDLLGIEHDLDVRWAQTPQKVSPRP